MSQEKLGRRYAQALFELALEKDAVRRVGDDLAALAETWRAHADLRTALTHPIVDVEEQKRALKTLSEGMGLHALLHRCLELMVVKRRLFLLPEFAEAYEELWVERGDLVRVEVATATDLPESYFNELKKILESSTGKVVHLRHHVEAGLLAGVVTRFDDQVIDGSLNGQLESLEETFVHMP